MQTLEIDYMSQLAQFQTEFLSILVLICAERIENFSQIGTTLL